MLSKATRYWNFIILQWPIRGAYESAQSVKLLKFQYRLSIGTFDNTNTMALIYQMNIETSVQQRSRVIH